jgi:hypothetical protein
VEYTVRYDVPRPGEEYEQTIFYLSRAYISAPVVGCSQTFRLEMAAGPNVPVPDYYDLDLTTGGLTFNNRANYFVDDRLVIKIYSTDGLQAIYPFVQTSQVIHVLTVCGPQSTIVNVPTLPVRTVSANDIA